MEQKDNFKELEVFAGSHKFFFIYKKTEKLVSAIYLVTNHISDSEPIKWALRESGTCLLEDVLSYSFTHSYLESVKKLQALFLRMISLLEISNLAGHISAMNFKVVSEEFKSLLKLLDSYHKERNENKGVAFPEDFFSVTENVDDLENPLKDIYNFQKDKPRITNTFSGKVSDRRDEQNNNSVKIIKDEVKNIRRESIISVLRTRGGGLTIKDVAGVVKGCSEKTIQRELGDLINKGVLRKEGERRWSRYFLK